MVFIPYRRKEKGNNNGYKPNKLFNTLAAGFLLFGLGYCGLSAIGDALNKAHEVTEQVEEIREHMNTDNSIIDADTQTTRLDAIVQNYLDDKLELEAEDIQELLEKVYDKLSYNNKETAVETLILLDYNDVNTLDKYTKNIIDKEYTSTITFNILVNEYLNEESAAERFQVIQQLANDTAKDSGFSSVLLSTVSNIPENNNLIIQVTYIK